MSDFKIPAFANEAEEAKWWFENDEKVSAEFLKAAKEDRLRRDGVARLLAEHKIQMPQSFQDKSNEASK